MSIIESITDVAFMVVIVGMAVFVWVVIVAIIVALFVEVVGWFR